MPEVLLCFQFIYTVCVFYKRSWFFRIRLLQTHALSCRVACFWSQQPHEQPLSCITSCCISQLLLFPRLSTSSTPLYFFNLSLSLLHQPFLFHTGLTVISRGVCNMSQRLLSGNSCIAMRNMNGVNISRDIFKVVFFKSLQIAIPLSSFMCLSSASSPILFTQSFLFI